MKTIFTTLAAGLALAATISSTTLAAADPTPERDQHRQRTKDQWKDIGTASAATAILGLITKNGTVTTLGTAGALYSA